MNCLKLHQTIRNQLNQHSKTECLPLRLTIYNYFLSQLDELVAYDVDQLLTMTRMTILFEGFCRHLSDHKIKKQLMEIRVQRWAMHFGTPTVMFLLTYKSQIDSTKRLLDELHNSNYSDANYPWLINREPNFINDYENDLIIDPKSISRIHVPQSKEIMGMFTKTHNPVGGFATTPSDPISLEFIKHGVLAAMHGGKILEIGAAFGAATLDAISKGATVFCNDIEPENLAVVRNRYREIKTDQPMDSPTGDCSQLVLIPGELPDELIGLPKQFFDAILICRVLHFFKGDKIEQSLAQMLDLLVPGGKIYIVCETPYLKNWQSFLPEFTKRVDNNVEWPGEINNPAEYESSGRAASLPKFVHWITKDILERSLFRTEFTIERAEYINRAGQFPDDLLIPAYGKESVGAIGVKGI